MTEKERISRPTDAARAQVREKLEDVESLTYAHYQKVRDQADGLDDSESDQVMTEIASVVIVEYLGEFFHRKNGVRALEEAKRVWTEAWDRLEAAKPELESVE